MMSQLLTFFSSAAVTLSALASAFLTVLLLRETRKMRKAQTEPKVDVTYRVREEWIAHVDILVRNIGLGGAYDVRFQAAPVTDDEQTHALIRELAEINFVRAGLHYLSPGQQAISFFTNVSENHSNKLHSAFNITVRYASDEGRTFEDRYCIDLSELIGLRRIGEPPLYKMAKSLEALQADFHESMRSRGYVTSGRRRADS